MSTKIGIVSEGISDYWALKHIVERYLKVYDVYTIPLQPKITVKGKQDGFGTWQGVFSYISGSDEQKLIVEAIYEGCKFVIIQIDTDVCEQYGIKKDTTNMELFWEQVKNKLSESVYSDFDKSVLIYAICINELECWLIPFVCAEKDKCTNINQCLHIVNRSIKSKGSIDKDNKNSDTARQLYKYILDQKKKPKEIAGCAQNNLGFRKFIDQLEYIKEVLDND